MVHCINSTLPMDKRLCKSSCLFRKLLCIISCDRNVVRPATSADTELTRDAFWRIALGENGVDCFLASSKGVTLQDFRVCPFSFIEGAVPTIFQSRASLDLFTMPRRQDVLTSIDHGGDNIVRLCSTRDIVWMDKRYPNKPLLGYQHGRQYDRSLEARTIQLQPRQFHYIFFLSLTKLSDRVDAINITK
jgi:hypothetical protein